MTFMEKLGLARAVGGVGRMFAQPGVARTALTTAGAGLGAYGMYRGAKAMNAYRANPTGQPGQAGVAPAGTIPGMLQQRNSDLEDAYNFGNKKPQFGG